MAAVPVLLHGDAAFPAQGVVAETLNLQSLEGYATGGTIHIIQNNQIGFTTDPEEGRSTPYAADMAKGFNVPIIHVNADDPEACVAAIRLAMAYRERWGRDVVIDLIGYRRFGHNETDEPAYTQPLMAAEDQGAPAGQPALRRGPRQGGDRHARRGRGAQRRSASGPSRRPTRSSASRSSPASTRTRPRPAPASSTAPAARASRPRSPRTSLRKLNEELLRVPDSFTIHRKLRKPLSKRLDAMDEGGIEFGHAEALALASLLTEGVHVRFTGQDTERGTFSHRHLVLHDEKTGLRYAPIQNLAEAKAPFELHNSPLSEIGLPRLRVRLLGRLAGQPGPLGGAVRRLRQLGAGDHRQLHRLGRGEVGPDLAADPAAAARLRGRRPRALERPDRALHPARRRGQHPARQPHHRRPVLPPAAPPGA